MINTAKPPAGFGTGSLYTAPLRIYFLELDPERRYWVYDHTGFLCSLTDLREVEAFLKAEASKAPDVLRRHYWPRARDLAYPGHAEELEAQAIKINEEISKQIRSQPRVEVKASPISLNLKDLGL